MYTPDTQIELDLRRICLESVVFLSPIEYIVVYVLWYCGTVVYRRLGAK